MGAVLLSWTAAAQEAGGGCVAGGGNVKELPVNAVGYGTGRVTPRMVWLKDRSGEQ